jgi:hypothetical protein
VRTTHEEEKMTPTILTTVQLVMAMILFTLGTASVIVGVVYLVTRSAGKEVRALATQTVNMAQKGLSDNVAGLVGNTSVLLNAINDLVRTTAGVSVFLTIIGLVLMAGGTWLILQIH